MKILFLAPLERKITPTVTASRPRVVFDLAMGLKQRGHKVTILGTQDSRLPGIKIIPVIKRGFYELNPQFENPFCSDISFLAKQAKMTQDISGQFDIIHNHAKPEFINILMSQNIKTPFLTTLHLPIFKEIDETLSMFPKAKLVCHSASAKKMAKKTKIYKVIPLGVDTRLYKFSAQKDNYLFWLGRLGKAKDKNGKFSDPKGVKWAIQLAKQTNSKLLLSGNVEDKAFFEQEVRPHLSKNIKWIGKVSFEQPLNKTEVAKIMRKAKAFLMTTQLPETFGLVMAEAQSCGTPVIGFKIGAVPEIITNNKTGFIVEPSEGIAGLKGALAKIEKINPADCRARVEKYFTLEKMVSSYEKTYQELIAAN